jgi:DNA-binding MarR family transcriptional regulator
VTTTGETWKSAVMGIAQPNGEQPTDLSTAVHDAAEALAVLWTRTAGGVAHQVSASQLRALISISRAGTTNLTQLAESLGAMLSSASRLCERLVAAGLIERRPAAANRHELALALTPEGERLLERLETQRRVDIAEILDRMTPAAQAQLLTGLEAFSHAAHLHAPASSSQSS